MIPKNLSVSKLAKLRESVRRRVVSEWHSDKRFDFTNEELSAEVESRLNRLLEKQSAQLDLDLEHVNQADTTAATRRATCNASQQKRITRRQQIVQLLSAAGDRGLTRSEIAEALKCRTSDICSPVQYLVKFGKALQPSTRLSPCGHPEAVIVLAEASR